MLVYPTTSVNNKINNHTFQGKKVDIEQIFNSQKFKEELGKIKNDKDVKNVFLGLSVLAGTILAELTGFMEQTPDMKNFAEKIINKFGLKDNDKLQTEMKDFFSNVLDIDTKKNYNNISEIQEQNPKRVQYLSILSEFPKLRQKYEEMLIKAQKEPNDINNKITMETLEIAFEQMTKDNRFQYYESIFEMLEKDYAEKLDILASTILNAYRNNIPPLTYLQTLKNKSLTPNEVTKWANAKNLTYDEFLKCKFLDTQLLSNLSDLKGKNKNFKIAYMKPFDNYKIRLYTFRLDFAKGLSLEDKLKTITDVHTAIYGSISLNDESDIEAKYMNSDIGTELADNLLKDRRMDAVYSFVKYINPEALKDINLTSQDVKFLSTENELYKKIKNICSKEIINLNPKNPRLYNVYEVIENQDMFGKIFSTMHSKIRFLTRFVLKNNPNPQNLLYACNSKINTLRKELDSNLSNCNIICFANNRGYAPQFYNHDSKLGKYIKITLNSSGNIHTIYEDNKKEVIEREKAL